MILLFYKIGVQWGYKSHPHSLKALILAFSAKSAVSGQIIAYCCKSILTIPSENVHAAHVSPDRNYLAPDIGWKQPIPSLGESL